MVRDGSAGEKRGLVILAISWWEAPKNLGKIGVVSSDPYCLVIASSEDSTFKFEQMTPVITQNCNPVWNQTLELPVVSNGSVLLNTLQSAGLEVDSQKLKKLFGGGSVDSQNSACKKLLD